MTRVIANFRPESSRRALRNSFPPIADLYAKSRSLWNLDVSVGIDFERLRDQALHFKHANDWRILNEFDIRRIRATSAELQVGGDCETVSPSAFILPI